MEFVQQLYDGGWTSDDVDQLQARFDLSDDELDDVVSMLLELEYNGVVPEYDYYNKYNKDTYVW